MSVQIADLPSLAGDRTPIPVNYVRNLVELVHEFGLDTDRLLAHVGLTQAEVYSAEPALRFEQFQRVMAGARDLSGDPAIGLALGRQLTVTAHGLLGYAAISSADLGEALELLERYFRTRTRLCLPRLSLEGRWVRFCLAEPYDLGDIREPYLEVVTAALVGGLRYLLDDRLQDATLELPYAPPPHAERYAEVLGMPVVFGREVAALRFPARLMKVAFPLSDPASRRMAAHKCEEELQRLEADLDAARLMTYKAAWMADNGQANSKEASMCKAKAGRMGNDVTLKCVALCGELGYSERYLLEKLARDSKIIDIFEGTQQIQQLIVARHLLGLSSRELK